MTSSARSGASSRVRAWTTHLLPVLLELVCHRDHVLLVVLPAELLEERVALRLVRPANTTVTRAMYPHHEREERAFEIHDACRVVSPRPHSWAEE